MVYLVPRPGSQGLACFSHSPAREGWVSALVVVGQKVGVCIRRFHRGSQKVGVFVSPSRSSKRGCLRFSPTGQRRQVSSFSAEGQKVGVCGYFVHRRTKGGCLWLSRKLFELGGR